MKDAFIFILSMAFYFSAVVVFTENILFDCEPLFGVIIQILDLGDLTTLPQKTLFLVRKAYQAKTTCYNRATCVENSNILI